MLYNKRIAPILLYANRSLVKGEKFANLKIIGDPLNSVRIFNDYGVDELVVLDVDTKNQLIDFEYAKMIASIAKMPLIYGGKIRTSSEAERIISLGYERITLNSIYHLAEKNVEKIVENLGSQAVIASIDYAQNNKILRLNKKRKMIETKINLRQMVEKCISLGCSELLLSCVERENAWQGTDVQNLEKTLEGIQTKIIVHGGIGSVNQIREAMNCELISAVGVGSYFVYSKPRKGVLVSMPDNLKNKRGYYELL